MWLSLMTTFLATAFASPSRYRLGSAELPGTSATCESAGILVWASLDSKPAIRLVTGDGRLPFSPIILPRDAAARPLWRLFVVAFAQYESSHLSPVKFHARRGSHAKHPGEERVQTRTPCCQQAVEPGITVEGWCSAACPYPEKVPFPRVYSHRGRCG